MKTKKRFFLLGGLLIFVAAGITAFAIFIYHANTGVSEWHLSKSEYKRYFLTYANESGHDETFVGQVTN